MNTKQGKKELDAVRIRDLHLVLNKNSVLPGHMALVENRDSVINVLTGLGIHDSHEFLQKLEDEPSIFPAACLPMLKLLAGLLTFMRFRERKLSEVHFLSAGDAEKLRRNGMKASGDYLSRAALPQQRAELAGITQLSPALIDKLACVCDLMRLPGIMSLRAELYYDCNVLSISHMAAQDAGELKAIITEFVQKTSSPKSVPFDKELSTCTAWAGVLPKILVL